MWILLQGTRMTISPGQFGNQRAINVAGARETVGGQVVQQSGNNVLTAGIWFIMLRNAEASKELKIQTNDEELRQELEAHYSYMAKIQKVPNAESGTDVEASDKTLYERTNLPKEKFSVSKTNESEGLSKPAQLSQNLPQQQRKLLYNSSLFIVDSGAQSTCWANLSPFCAILLKISGDDENLDKMKEKGDPCILVRYSTQSKGYHVYNKRIRLIGESIHLIFDEIKEMSETSVANNTSCLFITQELDLLFGPLYDEFFNDGTSRVNKSSSPTYNSIQKDTLPSMNTQHTSEPTTPTNVHAEEDNDNQAEFTNPFCTPVQENAEVFFMQYCIVEPKNIKEAMVDSAWIEAIQEELYQFNRYKSGKLLTTFWQERARLEAVAGIFGAYVAHKRIRCSDHLNKVYQLRKALYGLKQAPESLVPLTWDSGITRVLDFELTAFSDVKIMPVALINRKKHFGGNTVPRSYALSWKPYQGDSLNLPDHRIHKDGDGDASFQLESDSLPHAHAQTTKTYYKHQDSRIMKAQELKTKTSTQTLIYKIFLQRYQVYQGRLLASFQDDAKYEHVGQDTRSQGGKDDQDGRIKI
ncbi:retrovirus-related pol polyprotein from transposon TNT 1-94 [Tanacetum coccineum]